jgi:organic radical activating enzyme
VSLEILHGILSQWHRNVPGMHHSLSLTGGEPLAQVEALQLWLPQLRELLPVYLETNGTLPAALEKIICDIDYVSMDFKLESLSGAQTPWDEHREFLRIAAKREGFVKVVVGEQTPVSELVQAAGLIHEIAPQMPLIIQPLTEQGRCAVRGTVLLQLQQEVSRIHSPVRVIPQTHRFIDVV